MSLAADVSLAALERRDARLRIAAWVVVLSPLLAALAVSLLVTPEDLESGRVVLTPVCTLRALFGVECPTCGMTRAFAALGHLRFADAVRYNAASPLVYSGFVAGAAIALRSLVEAVADARRAASRLDRSTR